MTRSRLVAAVFIATLFACARPGTPTDVEQPTPTKPASEAPVLVGRVLGHDGTPLSAAHLVLMRNNYRAPEVELSLAADGRFRVDLPGPGVYVLRLAGVDHSVLTSMFAVESGPVELHARLGTYVRAPKDQRVPVRLRYVDEAGEAGTPLGLEASRVDDRAHVYTVALEPPAGARAVQFQLVEPSGRSFNGPGAARWIYDGDGDFWAERELAGERQLELDLALLAPAGLEPSIEIEGDFVVISRGAEAHVALGSDQLRVRVREVIESAGDDEQRLCVGIEAIAADARATVEALTDAELREFAALAWAESFGQFARAGCLVAEDLAWVLQAVPAEREAWAFVGIRVDNMFGALLDDPRIQAFRRELAAAQSDPGLRAHLLYLDLFEADARGDAAAVGELYTALARDYDGTYSAHLASSSYDPDRPVQVGRTMPAWRFAGLDGAPVTAEALQGRPYLLDVWATWCGPCVEEMDSLHASHAALGGDKSPIEFVSVSFDDVVETVAAFRRDRWPMPWIHAHVPPTEHAALFEAWQFSSVPFVVLVDGDGQIVATEESLRHEELLPTLQAFVERRAPQ